MYSELTQALAKKVNLFILDDDRAVLAAVSGMFESPLISLVTASTMADAYSCIQKVPTAGWHVWILDIAVDEEYSGLELLKKFTHFPYIIMLSGLSSMTIASQALKLGAMAVFDKDPKSLDQLFEEVCKMAALGYLLRGKPTQYISMFQQLSTKPISTAKQWAEEACLSVRQVERICSLHQLPAPKYVIPAFYSLFFMLWAGEEQLHPFFTESQPGPMPKLGSCSFYKSHLDNCLREKEKCLF